MQAFCNIFYVLTFKHESYNDDNLLNDIAIFKLNKIVTLNQKVQLVCLPKIASSSYPSFNSPAWVVGWVLF